jgi:hypothetical protein
MTRWCLVLCLLSGSAWGITQPTLDQHTFTNPLWVRLTTSATGSLSVKFTNTETGVNVLRVGNVLPGATAFIFGFDGSAFVPLRGDAANGLDVDVTRIQGVVTFGNTRTGVQVLDGSVSLTNSASGVLMMGRRLVEGTNEVVGVTRVGTSSPFASAVYPMGSWVAQAQTSSVFVGTSAVPVFTADAPTPVSHLVFRNHSNTVTVFVGSSGVTTSNGIPIYPLEAFTMDATASRGLNWYAIVPSGSADLRIGRW